MQIMNWDDLKYLLAVHRKGTLSSASLDLGVNQTTVSRRIEKLEQSLSTSLLQRSEGKLTLTPEGQQALQFAESAEETFFRLEQSFRQTGGLKGSLKITAVDSLIDEILIPALPTLQKEHPNLQVTFYGSNSNLQINKFEADIAIRLARPETGTMIVSKLTEFGFALYGSPEMKKQSEQRGLQNVPWVAYDDTLGPIPEMQWLLASYPDVAICLKSLTAISLSKALAHNLAVGILPCFLGDRRPGLVRISGNQPILTREAWLVVHQDTYQLPRLRTAISWLKSTLLDNRNLVSGIKARVGT